MASSRRTWRAIGLVGLLLMAAPGYAQAADADGDGILDDLDDDDDGDGVLDADERASDSDMDGKLDAVDADDDGDGVRTGFEHLIAGELRDTDADATPDYLDADDDGDGVPTASEDPDPNGDGAPHDARSYSGAAADYLNADDDEDGLATIAERPSAQDRDTDGDGMPDHRDDDDDGDGRWTRMELGADTDGDGTPDERDDDDDGDGIGTGVECSDVTTVDLDADGVLSCLDLDSDGDTASDASEGLLDRDSDGLPDYVDAGTIPDDRDDDGVSDMRECAASPCPDSDADGIADVDDGDDDNDGLSSRDEDGQHQRDTDGDGLRDYLDTDDDGDGVPTHRERGTAGAAPDSDRDGVIDSLDDDDDGDGVLSRDEGAPTRDTNGDGTPDYLDPSATSSADAGLPDAGPGDAGAGGPEGGSGGGLGVAPSSDDGCTLAPGHSSDGPLLPLLLVLVASLLRGRKRLRPAVAALALLGGCAEDEGPPGIIIPSDGGPLIDAGLRDAGALSDASLDGCEMTTLSFTAADVVTRSFGAAVTGDRVHLVYLTNECAEVYVREARSLSYASFPSTGASAEVVPLASETCVPLREPTLLAYADQRLTTFMSMDGHEGDDIHQRELDASTPVTQTHTPDERELRIAGATLAGVPTVAYVPEPIHPGALAAAPIHSLQAGRIVAEVLPVDAQQHATQLALASIGDGTTETRGVAVWVSDLAPNVGAFLRRLDAFGRGIGEVVEISRATGEAGRVALATRGTGAGLIYTESFDGVRQELRFRGIAADGSASAPVQLTSATHDIGHIALAAYRTGYALASRNLGSELNPAIAIEVRAIDERGALGGTTHIAATTQTGTAVQVLSAVDGRLIVVWDEATTVDTDAAMPSSRLAVRAASLTCL